ncbi:MAG: LLM class flavin-dependent oxidoreductase [Nitrososphaerales archaeon]
MKFGIALETFTPPGKVPSGDSVLEMALLAEKLGFDSVWAWDHIMLGSRKVYPVLDSLTTLTAIGAKTSKIKIGTGVLILPLRNPVVLAKTLSTMQFLSNGRLILGCAAGWYEREFRAVGVDFKKRGNIFEESFQLVRKLLNERDVTDLSGSYNLEHAAIEPKTDRIPMLIGGYADTVLERAGRLADGWISYYYTAESYSESWNRVATSAKENGKNPESMRRVDIVPLAIASNFEAGDKAARDFTARYTDLPKNSACTVESSVRGSISECIEQIKKYESVGINDLVFIPSNYDIEQVEKAGNEILPIFIKK